jgi:hypothetical protein
MHQIHIIYFACRAHFECLYASLVSLKCVRPSKLGAIRLHIDSGDPLTSEQTARLRALEMGIEVFNSRRVTGYGDDTIAAEIEAFEQIHHLTQPGDYVAKVDSDILFLTDWVFRRVPQTRADIVGQPEKVLEPFIYTQGGCYFLSHQAINAICRLTPPAIAQSIEVTCAAIDKAVRQSGKARHPTVPEDAAICGLVCFCGGHVAFEPFHLPSRYKHRVAWARNRWSVYGPSWREIAGRLKARDSETLRQYFRILTGRYSVAHFWSKREMMLRIFMTRPAARV